MTDTATQWEQDKAETTRLAEEFGHSKPGDESTKTITVKDEHSNDIEVNALDFARIRLWLPTLTRVIQYGTAKPIFYLELTDGRRIEVGEIDKLRRSSNATLDAIAVEVGDTPPPMSPAKWHPIARALLAIRVVEDTGTTPSQETRGWIAGFLAESLSGTLNLDDKDDALSATTGSYEAFTSKDEHLYLRAEALDKYIRTTLRVSRGEVSKGALCARLRGLGFEYATVSDKEKQRHQRRYWRSPAGFNPKADQ
jgi:hypothetical protein